MAKKRLHLDFETRSEADLTEVGTYAYAVNATTQALLLAYGLEEEEVRVWEPTSEPIPADLDRYLADTDIECWAWNAAFERLIFRHVLRREIPIERWRCAQFLARYNGLPGYLEDAGPILGIPSDLSKMDEGKRLIRKFSIPYSDAESTPLFGSMAAAFRTKETDPEDWEIFRAYVRNDVLAEKNAVHYLEKISEVTEQEWDNYARDQRINDRGIPVDFDLIRGAIDVVRTEKSRLAVELQTLTQLENPNSDVQMLRYVRGEGYTFNKMGRTFVARALDGECPLTENGRKALLLRAQLAKSATDKFRAYGPLRKQRYQHPKSFADHQGTRR